MRPTLANDNDQIFLSEDGVVPNHGSMVVIGNGPVGMRYVQELIDRGFSNSIIVFGRERWQPYNRARLSSLLSGEVDHESLRIHLEKREDSEVYEVYQREVVDINSVLRTLTLDNGQEFSYSKLVLATGSWPHIPEAFKGSRLGGVYRFRDMSDVEKLVARRARSRHTVIIGGGLLGLEAAWSMLKSGTEVTVVQHSSHVMNKQLNQKAAEVLKENLRKKGINFALGVHVKGIEGKFSVEKIHLSDGSELDCDTIIFATGIAPNIDLARRAGVRARAGFVIDESMRTNVDGVFAIGECAEYNSEVTGLVNPGYEQASILASNICGKNVLYEGSIANARLKVVDEEVISCGELLEEEQLGLNRQIEYQDKDSGLYRRLVLKGRKLKGVQAVGEWQESLRLQEAVRKNEPLWPWQIWRFRYFGNIWPQEDTQNVGAWPEAVVVCQCNGVSRGQLSKAQEQGACSVAELSRYTGAGSSCGSCVPLLSNLVGQPVEQIRIVGNGLPLLIASSFSILVCGVFVVFAPIAYSQVVDTRWEIQSALWLDTYNKQVSGYTLLSLALLTVVFSMRKRIKKLNFGDFPWWRFSHVVVGALAALVLFVHTGGRFGNNLNAYLSISFLSVMLFGAAAGVVISRQGAAGAWVRRQRARLTWGHIILVWPLPTLLSFHILSVYYF